MADDYTPPLSPNITFNFKGPPAYIPPLSPNIVFNLGVDDGGGGEDGPLQSNYMMLLTM